jgi:hypothetical protein
VKNEKTVFEIPWQMAMLPDRVQPGGVGGGGTGAPPTRCHGCGCSVHLISLQGCVSAGAWSSNGLGFVPKLMRTEPSVATEPLAVCQLLAPEAVTVKEPSAASTKVYSAGGREAADVGGPFAQPPVRLHAAAAVARDGSACGWSSSADGASSACGA